MLRILCFSDTNYCHWKESAVDWFCDCVSDTWVTHSFSIGNRRYTFPFLADFRIKIIEHTTTIINYSIKKYFDG